MSARTASILLTLMAICQPIAAMLAPVFGIGMSPGERALAGGIPPELPPGVFFSIWGVIFALMAVCAVLSWREGAWREEGWREDVSDTARRAAFWLGLAGVGNVAWMLQNQLVGNTTLDFFILPPTLACAAQALRASLALEAPGWPRTAWRAASGLLAGWLCVASAIALPRVVREWMGLGATDEVWPFAWLAFLVLLACALGVRRFAGRSAWVLAAAGWGLAGIIANALTRAQTPLIGWTLGVAALIALALFRPRRQKPA